MQTIYEATAIATDGKSTKQDFNIEIDARKWVEESGAGRVVTFIKGFDGCERSCAMDAFRNGIWENVNIFG